VGKTTFEQSLRSLKTRGYLVLYGQSSGSVGAFDPQVLSANGSLFLTRPTLAHYTRTREELLSRTNELFNAVARKALHVRDPQTFALADARAAHEALEGRHTSGKVLLIP
jgi:NADPH2:quinone reductase